MNGNGNGAAHEPKAAELPVESAQENIFLFWPNIIGSLRLRYLRAGT